jgi:hypothetical protein
MKLYIAQATCSLAVQAVANELGLSPELVHYDVFGKTTTDNANFANVNPLAYVPVLELDNADKDRLTETIVITSECVGFEVRRESGRQVMTEFARICGLTTVVKALRKVFESRSGRQSWRRGRAKSPLIGLHASQYVHPLDVPRERDQRPFRCDVGEPAQRELPESHHVLDDPEHRFDRVLA